MLTEAIAMYVAGNSLSMVSKAVGVPLSTIRRRLIDAGVPLRPPAVAVRLAADQGRMGSGLRGGTHSVSDEARRNMSAAAKRRFATAGVAGVSKKPSGYIEHTTGPDKYRPVHVVLMEKHIGRRLFKNEVVHHRDENKENNSLDNLQLMTRAEHARLHALINIHGRARDEKGRLVKC